MVGLRPALMDYVTVEDLRAAIAPLPTREEMYAAFAPYPTREEVREEIRQEIRAALVPYPTREEMRQEIRAALVPYPTREEMRAEIREEGDRTRRHFDVLIESVRDDIRLLAEGLAALHHRVEDVRTELKADIAALDRRVMRLEARRA